MPTRAVLSEFTIIALPGGDLLRLRPYSIAALCDSYRVSPRADPSRVELCFFWFLETQPLVILSGLRWTKTIAPKVDVRQLQTIPMLT